MATITLQYDGRNRAANSIVEMIEKSGLFHIPEDDEPNQETIKAIKDAAKDAEMLVAGKMESRDINELFKELED